MYEEHAAIFPAWKKTMTVKQPDEMGDLFEEIEHKAFGGEVVNRRALNRGHSPGSGSPSYTLCSRKSYVDL
jgi:hypothetical protein